MPLEEAADAYETGSELLRELLEELALQPDEPRPPAAVERSLDWKRGRIAAIFGGYSNKAKTRYDGKRPFHFGLGPEGQWWIWMDADRARLIQGKSSTRG